MEVKRTQFTPGMVWPDDPGTHVNAHAGGLFLNEGGGPIPMDCLTQASSYAIIVCMRTTLNIDENILKRAFELTGIQEKTALVRLGLEALVARQSGKRLAALGGSEGQLRPIRRRR